MPVKKDAFRRAAVVALSAVTMLAGITCTDQSTGPQRFAAVVGFAPSFRSEVVEIVGVLARLSVTLDNVHVVLEHSDGTPAADTVVTLTSDSAVIDINVNLTGGSEVLDAAIDIRSGTTVMFSGTQKVTAIAGALPPDKPVDIPMDFSGPGATAVTLTVTPIDQIVRTTDSLTFVGTAKNAANGDIPNPIIEWTVKDAAIGSVTAVGKFKPAGPNVRGFTYVIGKIPGGPADSAKVFVTPVPTSLTTPTLPQTGAAGAAVAQPIVAVVKAADNLPVAGVTVNFAATLGGGSVLPASAVTDAAGTASTVLTLGATAGANEVMISSTGLTSVTATATGIAGAPAKVLFVTKPPASVGAGIVITPAVTARIADANGNTLTSSSASVLIGSTAGTTLGGTTTVSAVNGVATFSDLVFGGATGNYKFTVSSPDVAADSTPVALVAGAAKTLVPLTTVTFSDTIDATLPAFNTPSVVIKDISDNPVAGVAVTFRKGGGAGASMNGLPDSVITINTGADGIASLGTRKVQTGSGFDTVMVTAGTLTDTIRFIATVHNGLPHHLAFIAQPGNAVPNGDITTLLALQDRLNNAVVDGPGSSTTAVTIALKPSTGDPTATLSPGTLSALTTNSVNGIVTFKVRLDKVAVGYQLVATATGLTSATSSGFSVALAGAPGSIHAVSGLIAIDTIDASLTGAGLPTLIVLSTDSQPMAGVQVKWRRIGSSGGLINGVADSLTTISFQDGSAALTSRRLGTVVGFDSVFATADGLNDTLTFVAVVLNGKPTEMVFLSQPPTSSANVAFGAAVVLQDRLHNPAITISGTTPTVAIAIKAATGAVGAILSDGGLPLVANAAAGAAAFLAKIDLVGTGYVLTATSNIGLPTIESDAFNITAPVPATIQMVSGEGQGVRKGLAVPDSLVVIVKDALGNPISGYGLGRAINGGGSASGSLTTDAAGRVAQRWNAGSSGVQELELTASGGSPSALFHAFLAETLVVVTQPSSTIQLGVAFGTQPKVQVQDFQHNQAKVSGISIGAFAVLHSGGDCISSPTLNGTLNLTTDSNGEVQYTDLSLLGTTDICSYKLRFDDNSESLQSTFAQPQIIGAGAANHLVFSIQPPNATVSSPFSATVQAKTLGGFVDNSFTGNITIALGESPGTGTLSGTLVVAAVNGTAVFNDLSIDQIGAGYTLEAIASGLTGDESNAFAVVPAVNYSSIALPGYASGSHTCAISTTNSIYCWGFNSSGQIGLTPPIGGDCVYDGNDYCPKPIGVEGLPGTLTSLTAGAGFTCGLNATGTAYCWGGNSYISASYEPNAVGGAVQFSKISAGENFMCGIESASGTASCWGYNGYGNLGNNDGTHTTQTSPSGVYGGSVFVDISAGPANTCGVANSGIAYCWGDNSQRQLGNSVNSNPNSDIPVQVTGAMTWSKVATGNLHVCAIDNSGVAYCWGSNQYGQTGDNLSGFQRTTPSLVDGSHTFIAISSGYDFSCAIDNNNDGYCWGRGAEGQLGNGGTGSQSAPALVTGGYKWSSIKTGYGYACGVATNGKVYCWGQNSESQLGVGVTVSGLSQTNVPMQISAPGVYDPCSQGCARPPRPEDRNR
jgi:hypothetical protein